ERPSRAGPTSYATNWPATSIFMPAASTLWTCTKTSDPPPSGAIKPYPRSVLKNLTRPLGIAHLIRSTGSKLPARRVTPRRAGAEQNVQPQRSAFVPERVITPKAICRRPNSDGLADECERVGHFPCPQSHLAQPRRPAGLFTDKESPGTSGASSFVTKEKGPRGNEPLDAAILSHCTNQASGDRGPGGRRLR